ncbi:MAG: hypothetical protein H5T97_12410 [Firmicutes bacterium]|nr:hypothetical protein [Bacillota bacterium]
MVLGFVLFGLAVLTALSLPFWPRLAARLRQRGRPPARRSAASPVSSAKGAPSVKDVWGFDDVREGVVRLRDGRRCLVLRLTPVNFDLMSDAEQHRVETALLQACVGLDFPVQFLATTEAVETRDAVAALARSPGLADSPPRQEYARQLALHLESLAQSRAVLVRQVYAAVWTSQEDEQKAWRELHRRADGLAGGLARAGVSAYVLDSEAVLDVLCRVLNRGRKYAPSEAVEAGALEMWVGGARLGGAGVGLAEEGEKAAAGGG